MSYAPMVIEQGENGMERVYDVKSILLKNRIIKLDTAFDHNLASSICAQLMYLDNDNNSPISLYINSPGGVVYDGLAIYSTMQYIKSPVHTYIVGLAASMGSFIANAGEAGHRYMLPYATNMVHRVSSGTSGTSGTMYVQELQLEEVKRSFAETQRLNKILTEVYVKHNSKGKTYDEFMEIMKFDTYLGAEDAVEMGLVDHIVNSVKSSKD